MQQRFKRDYHDVYTGEVNNIALSSNDDKRLQIFDRIKTYPYGTNAFKVCESEMLNDQKVFLWNTYKKWSTLITILMKIKPNIILLAIYSKSSI